MAVVVADAGPLIALARVDALDLLRELFGRILVPEAVRAECCAKPGPDADRITAAITRKWLVVTPATMPDARAAQLGRVDILPTAKAGGFLLRDAHVRARECSLRH